MKLAWTVAVLVIAGCAPRAGQAPAETPGALARQRAAWAVIQPLAASQDLDPGFVFALVKIESNFNPRARGRWEARGLLQIKPGAWRAVSDLPFETGAWDPAANLGVGIRALGDLKRELTRRGVFSYPLLWASYRYGIDFVAARGFDMRRIPRPSDPLAYRLYSGDIHPLDPPR